MNTNLLIILAAVVVLLAQASTVLAVRRLLVKWCFDAYKAGVDVGKAVTLESDPFRQAYYMGQDIGIERGHQEALTDEALADLTLAELETLTVRLYRATAARYDALNADEAECEADR